MDVSIESKTLFPLYRLIPLIVLTEGFVSIAIEILTIRQLLPVAGGSVIVTSLIIGVFLLFLALGYRQGGRIERDLQKSLRLNFMTASVWLGIGLSYIFILTFFLSIQTITGPKTVYALLMYLLLITAPLIFILGQTIPITMNMIKQNKSAGVIGGDTLGLSTLGSFLGATVTAVIFMNYFGVAWTVFINFLLLACLALLFSENKLHLALQLVFTVFFVWFMYSLNVGIEKKLFITTNNYANYEIRDANNSTLNPGEKVLVINNSFSSFTDENKKGFSYIEAIKKILFDDLKLRQSEILVLGAGGFTLSAENPYNNHFTYVDIDKKIKNVIVPHFLNEVTSPLIVDDARHFVNTIKKQFDAIIIDAYTNVTAIPAHLLTREYMQAIKERLVPHGAAIFNVVANPTLSDPYSKRIDNTIRAVFHNCMVAPLRFADPVTNILYVCRNEASENDRVVYSDDLNTSTTDSFMW